MQDGNKEEQGEGDRWAERERGAYEQKEGS